ncbi:MAG: hypothetical protein IJ408_04180 [Clostridia bacterium]|nr:hypothetical protein [Clostridia bacterium]MBQ9121726.1 hypothetical protein [Clostridia bacterium]
MKRELTLKKLLLIVTLPIIVALLAFATYLFVWGGTPQFSDFDEVCAQYEEVSKIALDFYRENATDEEHLFVYINHDSLEYEEKLLPLTDAQKDSVEKAGKRFGYLRVYKDSVVFYEDETHYYGLIYSKTPLISLHKVGLNKNGREYHRINSRWYEWGCFGI